ncbi:unnamed protein product [Brachionus calyciflorus]|uniref:Uncharacterized protein n=1 Tax=Brachionus calyciflorus TaxID=104777 RepID=A0A813ZYG2_9BILA|nr:unnamed protein product [Brachionus calyciflorus]
MIYPNETLCDLPNEKPPIQPKKENSYLNILKSWCETSTSHGLPNLARNESRILRIAWAIATLASWSYSFYLVISCILAFFNYKTITNTRQVYEAPSFFPAVDVCNLYPYPDLDMTKDPEIYIHDRIRSADKQLYYVLIDIESSYNDSALYDSGFKIEDLIKSCKFNGKACDYSDFYRYHNWYHGNCYRFNGGLNSNETTIPLKNSSKAGWRNGLQLELYAGIDLSLTYRTGFRIVIHNQSEEIFPEEDGINVPAKTETNIGIYRTFIKRLSSPYNELNEKSPNNEIIQIILKEFNRTKYSQKFCQKICLQKYIYEKCKCMDLSLPPLTKQINKNLTGCLETDFDCRDEAEIEFFNSNLVDKCNSFCPLECTETIFSTEISSTSFPTEWYLENFIRKIEAQENNSNASDESSMLLVNIFYNDLIYTIIEESPEVTPEFLLGQIGGYLGLFIGISVLSCMENVELVILFILHYYEKRKTNKQKAIK